MPVDVQALPFAGDGVLFAGVGHELEVNGVGLQLLHQHGRVGEQHVVVGHAVHEQQRVDQIFRVFEHVGAPVGFGGFAFIIPWHAQVAFGVVGVVERPVGHRRDGDAGGEGFGFLHQHHQRHVAAVAPPEHADAVGVHIRL